MINLKEMIDELGGPDAVEFVIPMRIVRRIPFCSLGFRDSDDPYESQVCYVDEKRYRVDGNYKIELRAIDLQYSSETYYQSDLKQLLKSNSNFILRRKNLFQD
jgi:hypothetical protein